MGCGLLRVVPWLLLPHNLRQWEHWCWLFLRLWFFIHLQKSNDFVDVTFLRSTKLEIPVKVLVPKLKKFLHNLEVLFVFLRELGKIVGVSYFRQHFVRRILFLIIFVVEIGRGYYRHVNRELRRLIAVINWRGLVGLNVVLTPTRVSGVNRW